MIDPNPNVQDDEAKETTVWNQYASIGELPIAESEHWSPLRGHLRTTCGSTAEGCIVRLMRQDALLECCRSLPIGASGELEIRDLDGVLQLKTQAVVHWADLHDRYAGLFLHDQVPPSLREQLEFDKRQQLRYPLNVAATAWWNGEHEPTDVQIRDYSLDGLALETKGPVDVGTRVLVSLVGDNGRPVMLSGRACWQLRTRLRYLVGCALDTGQGRRLSHRSQEQVNSST